MPDRAPKGYMSKEMTESMDMYKDELEQSFRKLNEGDIITGHP